jgi:hypothetical protein
MLSIASSVGDIACCFGSSWSTLPAENPKRSLNWIIDGLLSVIRKDQLNVFDRNCSSPRAARLGGPLLLLETERRLSPIFEEILDELSPNSEKMLNHLSPVLKKVFD